MVVKETDDAILSAIDGIGYGTATIKKFGSWAVEIR